MSTSRRQTFFMNDIARSSSASLGIFGSLADASGTLAGGTGAAAGGFGHDAARQLDAARQQRFLQRGIVALQPADLAFERRALVGHHLAGPAGGAPCRIAPAGRCGNRAARSRRPGDGSCSGCHPGSVARRRILRRRVLDCGALGQCGSRPGESSRQNQNGGADWGKTIHDLLPAG